MNARAKKPKTKTLTQEAEALGFELDNLLTTEFSAALTGKGELRRANDLIGRLTARLKRTEGLIDGYALNHRRGSAGAMNDALEAQRRDCEARHPRWRKRKAT